MTPLERAEKIVTKFNSEGACLSNSDETYLQELIAAQIEEAEREAFKNGRLDAQYDADTLPEQIEVYKKTAYAEGFRAGQKDNLQVNGAKELDDAFARGFECAREKAKRVAETVTMEIRQEPGHKLITQVIPYHHIIAQRIGEMEP